jgi:hypothetical protein
MVKQTGERIVLITFSCGGFGHFFMVKTSSLFFVLSLYFPFCMAFTKNERNFHVESLLITLS